MTVIEVGQPESVLYGYWADEVGEQVLVLDKLLPTASAELRQAIDRLMVGLISRPSTESDYPAWFDGLEPLLAAVENTARDDLGPRLATMPVLYDLLDAFGLPALWHRPEGI